jgi:hypothetical protein
MKPLALVFVTLVTILPGFSQRSKFDPMPRKPAAESSGFVDSSLGRINPNNTDYGWQIDTERQFVVEQSLKNLEFWIVGITVSLLIVSFFMLLHQSREQDRKEIIAAGLLSQYHNAWVDAWAHADDAIRRHNDLVKRTNEVGESTLRAASQENDQTHTHSEQTGSFDSTKPTTKHSAVANGGARLGAKRGSRSDSSRQSQEVEFDSIAQISVLQKQLEASRERETNLQKQLAAAERRCSLLQSSNTAVSG